MTQPLFYSGDIVELGPHEIVILRDIYGNKYIREGDILLDGKPPKAGEVIPGWLVAWASSQATYAEADG